MYDTFALENVTKEDMKELANNIEEYINQLESVMIIPEELQEQYGDKIEEGLKITKKLINKLRKGDKSVFKEEADQTNLNNLINRR